MELYNVQVPQGEDQIPADIGSMLEDLEDTIHGMRVDILNSVNVNVDVDEFIDSLQYITRTTTAAVQAIKEQVRSEG